MAAPFQYRIGGHDVPLEATEAEIILAVLAKTRPAAAYNDLHDAYVRAGGIPCGNGGFAADRIAA